MTGDEWPKEFWPALGAMSEDFERPQAPAEQEPRSVALEAEDDQADWEEDFAAAARRPLRTRLRYAFVHTYKPVMDDASYRSFSSLAEYREWCARNLPSWLGYGSSL